VKIPEVVTLLCNPGSLIQFSWKFPSAYKGRDAIGENTPLGDFSILNIKLFMAENFPITSDLLGKFTCSGFFISILLNCSNVYFFLLAAGGSEDWKRQARFSPVIET